MDNHQKGEIAEANIKAHLIERGYSVLDPVSDHSRYDLAIDKNGQLIRIQCKYARLKEDERGKLIRFNTESHSCGYDGFADYIVGYSDNRDEVYFISVEDAPTGQITLRPPEVKLKRTNYTTEYTQDIL